MASIGKKILSAFVEVKPEADPSRGDSSGDERRSNPGDSLPDPRANSRGDERQPTRGDERRPIKEDDRFREYFDKLFREANIPGPDYYEFSKMIDAMQSISGEQAKFYAAYAGLQVQGLDKDKLLATANQYMRALDTDASHFQATVDTALREKVQGKAAELEEKDRRIRALTEEIGRLQQEIVTLQGEIKENQEKIETSTGGYRAESENRKARIQSDIEKIKHYIQ